MNRITDGTLHKYFLQNGEKRLHKWFHYFDVYERHFNSYRDRPIKLLEIGVMGGGSLAMWRDYFHKESVLVGIDISKDCLNYADESQNIHVRIGNQDNEKFLQTVIEEFGDFDIIIDDGGHQCGPVIKSFEVLFPHLTPYGVYLIEDLHTSYWEKFGGGFRTEGTSIEFLKGKIDEINAVHVRRDDFPINDITKSVFSLCFYDSIAVVEKAPQGERRTVVTKAM